MGSLIRLYNNNNNNNSNNNNNNNNNLFTIHIQAEDPYVADLLRMADDKIAELTATVNVAQEERDGAQMKIDSFRQQVDFVTTMSYLKR